MHSWRMAAAGMVLALTACGGKDKDEDSTASSACDAYTITVNVTTAGEPLEEATVTAILASDPTQEIACSGAGGTFTCTITQADIWKIYAEATSYEPYGKELDLTTDVCEQTLDADLLRESGV